MNFSISKQAFSRLDKNADKKVSFSEIKKLDANNDQEISKKEAEKQGIKSDRDRSQLNQALKFFEGSEPTEVVFENNRESKNPLDFSDQKSQTIIKKFGLKPSKGQREISTMSIVDNVSPLKNYVLDGIGNSRELIKQHARENGVNPVLVASIIMEEQMHLFPPIFEDSAMEVADYVGLKQNTSVGPGQLGVGELIKQGFYESEGIPKSASSNKLSASQIERGKSYLRDRNNGIKTLARQIARIKNDLAYPAEPLDLSTFQGQKRAALISYIHNGYEDYASRILDYVKDLKLKAAIYPPRRPPTHRDILPHTL